MKILSSFAYMDDFIWMIYVSKKKYNESHLMVWNLFDFHCMGKKKVSRTVNYDRIHFLLLF